jgi:hypothetical protein
VIGLVGFGVNVGVTILAGFMMLASDYKCPTVYWTDDDLFEPEPVSDFHVSHEHWALHPIKVERIGYIDCMRMVTHKEVDIVKNPNYVEKHYELLAEWITESDRQALLKAL